MLTALLGTIARGGALDRGSIAAGLGISHPLLEQMLADLERMGYLEALEESCAGSGCDRCADRCSPVSTPAFGRVWTVTERGRRALRASDNHQ